MKASTRLECSPSATESRLRSLLSSIPTRSWTQPSASTERPREVYELIVIGTSWGGLDALSRLLAGLHDDVHQPIVIAQHRSPDGEEIVLERLLQHHTRRVVRDWDDKTPLERDHVYL